MKKVCLLLIALGMMITTAVYAYDDGDFQVWNTDSQEMKIGKNLKAVTEEEFRWGDNAREFYYHHYDAGLVYASAPSWNIGGGYRYIYALSRGKFTIENEPYVTATLFWQCKGFTIDTRSRVEYQHFEHQDDNWRYRNKLSVKFPWKFTKWEIQPFVSDEIFVRFDDSQRLNQNRLASGLGMKLTKNVKAEIYYMLVASKGSAQWTKTNLLGTKIKLFF
jgi:hypothetical protein